MNIEEMQTKLEETTEFILDWYSPSNDEPRTLSWASMQLSSAMFDLRDIIRELEYRIDALENPSEYDAIMLKELGSQRRY